jgi:hypothetical protein
VIELTKRKLKKKGGRVKNAHGEGGGGLKEVVGFSTVRGWQRYRQMVVLVGMKYAKKTHKAS